MKNLYVVALILLLVIVIGAVIRGTMFQKYLPEGFTDGDATTKTETEEEKKPEPETDSEGEKKTEKKEPEPVQVDTTQAMKSFMKENKGNKGMMDSITGDTRAMIENQKELIQMMNNVQPALQQGMEFMKAFKGMMGSN